MHGNGCAKKYENMPSTAVTSTDDTNSIQKSRNESETIKSAEKSRHSINYSK